MILRVVWTCVFAVVGILRVGKWCLVYPVCVLALVYRTFPVLGCGVRRRVMLFHVNGELLKIA